MLPDRFSNRDHPNDKFSDVAYTVLVSQNSWLRLVGDLQGIIKYLAYRRDLGFTAESSHSKWLITN
ncbi:MAG: glycosidase [Arcticibacterium sp.]|jgi:glycosidase